MERRRTSRQLASPKEIAKRQADQFIEERAAQKKAVSQLKALVNSDGWQYAKKVMAQIVEMYATVPPRNAEQTIAFVTGQTLRYAFELFVQIIEKAAVTGILVVPTKEENGDNGSDRKN